MHALLQITLRALRSIFAPGMFGVFIWSLLITIGALSGFVLFAGLLLHMMADSALLSWWVPYAGMWGAAALAWFLFPGIMPIFVNFFDARIAHLIERQDYPQSVASNPTPFWKEFWHDVRFSLLAVTLNIVVLPLYLLMPGLHFLPFYLLNGYLLGREFFIMAARRHMPIDEAILLRRQHAQIILAAGTALAVMATLPLVNLVAPFWGVAVMVHLYHRVAANDEKPKLLQ